MPLIAKRKLDRTWREAVRDRCGATASQALAEFDALAGRRGGAGEADAAYRVLAKRGLLWSVDEPEADIPGGAPGPVPSV